MLLMLIHHLILISPIDMLIIWMRRNCLSNFRQMSTTSLPLVLVVCLMKGYESKMSLSEARDPGVGEAGHQSRSRFSMAKGTRMGQ